MMSIAAGALGRLQPEAVVAAAAADKTPADPSEGGFVPLAEKDAARYAPCSGWEDRVPRPVSGLPETSWHPLQKAFVAIV